MEPSLKPVHWLGDSLKELKRLPSPVKQEIGFALHRAQEGKTRLSSFFPLTGPEHAVHAAIQASARYFNDGVGSSRPTSLPFICLAEEVSGKSFFAISTISSNFS